MPVNFGGVEVRTVKNSIRELEATYQGARGYHADGSGWSTERNKKRRAQMQIVFTTQSEKDLFFTAIGERGSIGPINWPDGDTTDGYVDVTGCELIQCNPITGGFLYNNAGLYLKYTIEVTEA
jgi:hypothetical protein